MSPRTVQLYFGILETMATEIVPEARQLGVNGLQALTLDTFATANVFFSETFGTDLPRYQRVVDLLTQKINKVVRDLIQGNWEGI